MPKTTKKTIAKKTAQKKTAKKKAIPRKKAVARKAIHHRASHRHLSPWWVFWTYLFGILFLGLIVGGAYTYYNPGIIKKIDDKIGASILEDNVEKFCDEQLFKDKKGTMGLFEVNGFVCQSGSIIPIEIIYDSECEECLSPSIENTLQLLMPTSVITKVDARGQGAGIPVGTLPYVIIDKKIEGAPAMQILGEKLFDAGEKYLLNASTIADTPRTVITEINLTGSPFKGDTEAPLTVVEFIGTKCPACASFSQDSWEEVKEILIDEDMIKYVSKILPIGEDEEQAQMVANATLCANDQGKYFEYINKLYSFDGEKDKDVLVEIAGTVKLGGTEFKTCLEEKRFNTTIKSFISELKKLEINTIPSYLVGNRLYAGPLSFEELEKLVNDELQRRAANQETKIEAENINDEPILGTGDLGIQIYSDFECNQCYIDWQMIKEAIKDQEDRVAITFTNFPDQTGAYSELAAIAGECAVSQGNFWDYMNLLFDNGGNLRPDNLERLGVQSGFGGEFTACMRASETLPEVYSDIETAKLAGVEKAPVYIIDSEIIEAPDSIDGWKELINEKLGKQ